MNPSKGGTGNPFDAIQKNLENCDRPACDDTVSALSAALERIGGQTRSVIDKTISEKLSIECPPSKDSLGRSSWSLLHSMAAWYPDKPSLEEETKMKNFMDALSIFYPCSYCARDFQENLAKSPVRTESRKDLSIWLCEQHNIVNEKLGKPLFRCDMNNLDKRWRKNDDPRCGGLGKKPSSNTSI